MRLLLYLSIQPKGIVILAIDFAGNVSWTTWGDQSYNKWSMAMQTWSVTPSTGINQTKPAKITAWGHTRLDWTITVKNASGQIVSSWTVKNEHTLREQWTPDSNLPNGTYTITLDLVTKDGFKVTSLPKTVTVVQ